MSVRYRKKEELTIVKEIGRGGEGTVSLLDNGMLYKEYSREDSIDIEKLKLLSNIDLEGVFTPKEIIIDENNKVSGYTMYPAKDMELKSILLGKVILERKAKGYKRIDLLKVALDFVTKLDKIHKQGVLIGDINEKNLMIDIEKRTLSFIDTDSYQIGRFPCNVGTPDYTAPEIQGIDFRSQLRTLENELFAAAVMVFTILMPGQKPYAYVGGEDVVKNIKEGLFPYPLGLDEDYEYKEPKGRWDLIWKTFDPKLKKAFHDTFKSKTSKANGNNIIFNNKKRVTLEEWKKVLEESIQNIEIENIYPDLNQKIEIDGSSNLNKRWTGVGEARNMILRNARQKDKIAVIELSTKAVKVLIKNNLESVEEFSYDDFGPKNGGFRDAKKTETGNGLDKDNNMDMDYFKSRVAPSIKKYLEIAKNKYHVKFVYCIATAAIRTARNRDEILKYLKSNFNLKCKVLSKEEEALITAKGFKYTGSSRRAGEEILEGMENKNIAFIDQGGGSTEFILYRNGLDKSANVLESLNLGTTALKNSLYINSLNNTSLEKAFEEIDIETDKKLRTLFSKVKIDKLDACIAVGTAITNATGKQGNKKQHCSLLTKEKMKRVSIQNRKKLIENFKTVGELKSNLENMNIKDRDKLDIIIVMALGLSAYIKIIDKYNLDNLVVSGTGLWYGQFYEAYEEIAINKVHKAA